MLNLNGTWQWHFWIGASDGTWIRRSRHNRVVVLKLWFEPWFLANKLIVHKTNVLGPMGKGNQAISAHLLLSKQIYLGPLQKTDEGECNTPSQNRSTPMNPAPPKNSQSLFLQADKKIHWALRKVNLNCTCIFKQAILCVAKPFDSGWSFTAIGRSLTWWRSPQIPCSGLKLLGAGGIPTKIKRKIFLS